MPSAPAPYCSWIGAPRCRARVPGGGRCPKHRTHGTPGYGHRAWIRFSRDLLARRRHCECPGCPRCAGDPCTRASSQTDHIDGRGLDGPRAYDETNCRALCASCHSWKTATVDGGFGRPRRRR